MLKLISPRKIPVGTPVMTKTTSGLNGYQKALLGNMKEVGEKAMDMSKTSEVLQGPDESPSQFHKHLCEAFCLYIPL
jgi:hypothetical protein